jgi:hypothetical protein
MKMQLGRSGRDEARPPRNDEQGQALEGIEWNTLQVASLSNHQVSFLKVIHLLQGLPPVMIGVGICDHSANEKDNNNDKNNRGQ